MANANVQMETTLVVVSCSNALQVKLITNLRAVALREAHLIHLVDLQLAVEDLQDLLNVWDVP